MNTPSFFLPAVNRAARPFLASLLLVVASLSAQPDLPQSGIPADLPADIREPLDNLYSANALTRASAAQALREFRAPLLRSSAPYLAAMLADEEPLKISVSYNPFGGIPTSPGEEAAKTLAKLGHDALPLLTAALADKRPHVRKSAAVGLGETGLEEAAPPLLKALETEGRVPVACAILEALGKIQEPSAITPLLKSLDAPEWEIRKAAAASLCAQLTRDVRMVVPLLAFLQQARKQSSEFAIVSTVESKLGDLTGIYGTKQDERWTQWAQEQAR